MALTETLPWTCRCGTSNVATARVSWPIDDDPLALEAIRANTFHRFACTSCGYFAVMDRDLLVLSRRAGWLVYAIRDPARVEGALAAMRRDFAGLRARVVADRNALVERVRLMDDGVDDLAVEAAKHLRRATLGPEHATSRLLYERAEADSLDFAALAGARFLGHVSIPRASVEQLATELDTASLATSPVVVDEALAGVLLERRRGGAPGAVEPWHRYVRVPHVVDRIEPSPRGFALVTQRVALDIDATTGEARLVKPPEAAPSSLGTLAALAVSQEETVDGPFTTIEGHRMYGVLLDGALAGDLVVLLLETPGAAAPHVIVPYVRGRAPQFALPAQKRPRLLADADLVVSVEETQAIFLRAVDGELALTAAAVPSGFRLRTALGPRELAIEADGRLFLYSRRAFAQRPGLGLQAARFSPLVAPARRAEAPAKVVAVVGASLLVDHPTLGRLRLKRSTEMQAKAGEAVFLDDVVEELPRVFRVHAYHLDAQRVEVPVPAAPIVLAMPAPPRPIHVPTGGGASVGSRPSALAEALAALEAQALRPSPFLRRLVDQYASDPILARALERLSLPLCDEPLHLARDWEADPLLLSVIEPGDGDAFALHIYPPWITAGHEPMVMHFQHDEGHAVPVAETFEALFRSLLASAASRSERERALVEVVRARLAVDSVSQPLGEVERYGTGVLSDPLLARERTLRAAAVRGEAEREALLEVYRTLGWDLPLRALALAAS